MKKLFFLAGLFFGTLLTAQAQQKYEYVQVTAVESVVPGGMGRSRMVTNTKDGKAEETDLKNFFSITGINFGNVANNDRLITNKITEMSDQGWELIQTYSGVYGTETSTGIFITRYLFRRPKQ